nr:putative secreted protein [Streptomyces mirabilis]
MRRRKRTVRTTALAVGALIASLALPAGTARADGTTPRVDLRVLVVSDGGPSTDAIAAELDASGTPYTEVDLHQSGRPVLDAGLLAYTVDGRPRAEFQAVVLPDDDPFAAGSPEMAAPSAYEQSYAIPQVDAYTYARPEAGLQYPVYGGCSGSLDGVRPQVTAAGRVRGQRRVRPVRRVRTAQSVHRGGRSSTSSTRSRPARSVPSHAD